MGISYYHSSARRQTRQHSAPSTSRMAGKVNLSYNRHGLLYCRKLNGVFSTPPRSRDHLFSPSSSSSNFSKDEEFKCLPHSPQTSHSCFVYHRRRCWKESKVCSVTSSPPPSPVLSNLPQPSINFPFEGKKILSTGLSEVECVGWPVKWKASGMFSLSDTVSPFVWGNYETTGRQDNVSNDGGHTEEHEEEKDAPVSLVSTYFSAFPWYRNPRSAWPLSAWPGKSMCVSEDESLQGNGEFGPSPLLHDAVFAEIREKDPYGCVEKASNSAENIKESSLISSSSSQDPRPSLRSSFDEAFTSLSRSQDINETQVNESDDFQGFVLGASLFPSDDPTELICAESEEDSCDYRETIRYPELINNRIDIQSDDSTEYDAEDAESYYSSVFTTTDHTMQSRRVHSRRLVDPHPQAPLLPFPGGRPMVTPAPLEAATVLKSLLIDDTKLQLIDHSVKFQDEVYEYRYVVLPRDHPFLALDPHSSPRSRLLNEVEWRLLGIRQTRGWEHYGYSPHESNILLFRRALNTDPQTGAVPVRNQLRVAERATVIEAEKFHLKQDVVKKPSGSQRLTCLHSLHQSDVPSEFRVFGGRLG